MSIVVTVNGTTERFERLPNALQDPLPNALIFASDQLAMALGSSESIPLEMLVNPRVVNEAIAFLLFELATRGRNVFLSDIVKASMKINGTFNLFIFEYGRQIGFGLSRDTLALTESVFPGTSLELVVKLVANRISRKLDTDTMPFVIDLLMNGSVQVLDLYFEINGPFLNKQSLSSFVPQTLKKQSLSTLMRKKVKRRK